MSLAGLERAIEELHRGRPVIVPNPAPMTYGLVAADPVVVNAVKGRPHEQPVGIAVHDAERLAQVVAVLDLDPDAMGRLDELLRDRLSVLAPLATTQVPGWLQPSIADGWLALFDPRWEPTAAIWDGFPLLYGSSANRSGRPPATTAADAEEMFGPDVVVIDGDEQRGPGPWQASTMARLESDGTVTVHRPGAQDVPEAPLRDQQGLR